MYTMDSIHQEWKYSDIQQFLGAYKNDSQFSRINRPQSELTIMSFYMILYNSTNPFYLHDARKTCALSSLPSARCITLHQTSSKAAFVPLHPHVVHDFLALTFFLHLFTRASENEMTKCCQRSPSSSRQAGSIDERCATVSVSVSSH